MTRVPAHLEQPGKYSRHQQRGTLSGFRNITQGEGLSGCRKYQCERASERYTALAGPRENSEETVLVRFEEYLTLASTEVR